MNKYAQLFQFDIKSDSKLQKSHVYFYLFFTYMLLPLAIVLMPLGEIGLLAGVLLYIALAYVASPRLARYIRGSMKSLIIAFSRAGIFLALLAIGVTMLLAALSPDSTQVIREALVPEVIPSEQVSMVKNGMLVVGTTLPILGVLLLIDGLFRIKRLLASKYVKDIPSKEVFEIDTAPRRPRYVQVPMVIYGTIATIAGVASAVTSILLIQENVLYLLNAFNWLVLLTTFWLAYRKVQFGSKNLRRFLIPFVIIVDIMLLIFLVPASAPPEFRVYDTIQSFIFTLPLYIVALHYAFWHRSRGKSVF